MFENLSQKLEAAFKKLRGLGKLTPQNIEESLREVRRALLDADVNYKVAKQFIEDVQKRAVGQEVLNSVAPGQLIVKIIHDEMVKLLGVSRADVVQSPTPPTVILVAGLQGSGKTTFSAKLANLLKGKGRLPLLVAADMYRPAAIDQLVTLGSQIDVPVFWESSARSLPKASIRTFRRNTFVSDIPSGMDRTSNDAVKIAADSLEFARKNIRDTVIIDTAGRMHVDETMMREVEAVKQRVQPHEILFVVDSMTGQDAVNTAKAFHDRLQFDGVVLTKLDGDTRGGAALSIRAVVQKPIKFIGVGEKLDALEPFYPDRIASRILGMGDIVTLVEKAQQSFDEEKAVEFEQKLRKASFTFDDFLNQLQEVRKMGPLSQVMSMIPGMNRLPAGADIDERNLVRVEAIIRSMTKEERSRPAIINGNRRKRIALGSGTTVQDVNRLLKQFEEMQKMMKRFSKGNMRHAMRGMRFPMN
ncbi:MAG: signal recognition particle protein [Ignavibacteriales bacterium]|nr:signal recognition particle protein [Ignavibacteriales bacterium]